MRSWEAAIVLVALSGLLLVAPGCASEQHSYGPSDSIEGIERPARPLEEEESLSDKIGEVGVVLLVIGAVAVPILLGVFLFSKAF